MYMQCGLTILPARIRYTLRRVVMAVISFDATCTCLTHHWVSSFHLAIAVDDTGDVFIVWEDR